MSAVDIADKPKDTGRIARSTLTLIVAFAAAKAISLVQTVIIARTIGLSSAWDAYVAANRAPELIYVLIAGGALAYAFIPVFGGQLAKGDDDGAWRTASNVINTIFLAAFTVSALVFIFAPAVIGNLIAPGFDAETQAATVTAMRILLLGTLLFAVSGIVSGILHSHQHFLLPALSPIMYDIGILIGVIFLLPPFGVNGIAWGTVLGAVMHLGVQIPGLVRFGFTWRPNLGWNNPHLRRVIVLMLPRIAGLGVFQFNFLLMTNVASRLGEGSVSAWDWGYRIMQIPQTLIGTAMGIVIFPTLAALSEIGDDEGKRGAMSGALRFIFIGSIPSAVGVLVVGRPLISLLEGGAFDASATGLVYDTLRFFALAIIVQSLIEIGARSFYADKDTVTPLWAAIAGASVNAVMALTFTGVAFDNFTPPTFVNLGVGGIALAYSMGMVVEISVLLYILRRRWNWSLADSVGGTVFKTLVASLVMALVVIGIEMLWAAAGLTERGRLLTAVQVLVMTGGGAVTFAVAATVLRMNEIWDIVAMILRRRKYKVEEAIA